MTSVKVIEVKNWCNSNLSPVAWTRIVISSLSKLNTLGYTLNELDNPNQEYFFDKKALEIVNDTCQDLYRLNLPIANLVSI